MIVYPTTAKTTNGAFPEAAGKLVDDWLRRELRVGDPKDPNEVSKALLGRYKPEAIKLEEETRGLSVPLRGPVWQLEGAAPSAAASPGSREIEEVEKNLETDSTRLASSSAVREWVPEMEGWKQTLIREVSNSADAARYAQDAASRDRAFLGVRRLSDYARVARLISIRNAEAMFDFRRLAITLDEAAFAIRILMGEALYNAGLTAGGFIIQVPLTDARQRRDGVMLALRRLLGANESDQGFGNGPFSYGALVRDLVDLGHTELRVYLREPGMAQVLDDLLGSASRQQPESLRSLSATAPVEIHRLQRLLQISALRQPPPSSPLSAFAQTLRLFLDAFAQTRAGARLIDLAVPLPLAAKETSGADLEGRRLLRALVSWRAEFAREVECFQNCCACDATTLAVQQLLDFGLFLVDRAIDLIAVGQGTPPSWDDEEQQAAALLRTVENLRSVPALAGFAVQTLAQALPATGAIVPLGGLSLAARTLLFASTWTQQVRDHMAWRRLVEQLSPRCAKFP